MTTSSPMNRHSIAYAFAAILMLAFASCKKNDQPPHPFPQQHSAEVVDKWITLQLRLMRNATGIPNHGFSRHYAYTGVALFESIAPQIPGAAKWSASWNGLTGLPSKHEGKQTYAPAAANAALASINKAMFANANAADKAAIDSLEAALKADFLTAKSQGLIDASENFGKAVATAVFNWAETDGYKNANAPYTVPTGTGVWKPTAPAFAPPATPYWGQNRTIIRNSLNNAQQAAPIAFSTNPSSPFYNAVKEVYEASKTLTDDQKAMASFWRDVPGATSPGHWLSILQQAMKHGGTDLYKAAIAYALTGAAGNDALIACFITKYSTNVQRPITYIREVMGQNDWVSFLGTPAHPEYPSAHSSLSAAAAAVMEEMFSVKNSFTDHTYDYLGLAPRTYTSFAAIGEEAGRSRLYAGIHYTFSINAGLQQGKKVADNIIKGSIQ